MSARHAPQPSYRVPSSPEVAELDGLGHTLRIALAVTRAMNPDVDAPWSSCCPLRRRATAHLLTTAESLLSALAEYRLLVDCDRCALDDDDLPF